VRTRDAIAEALLELLEAGDTKPTARAVAAHAGVSLRSVFQHFDDMEALYAVCVTRQEARLADLQRPLDAAAPLPERVRLLAEQRARLYERIAPVRRASVVAAHSSPVLQEALARMARAQRRELARCFGRESAPSSRRELLAAVEAATSFDVWDHLRRVQGLSAATAQRVVRNLVTGALREHACSVPGEEATA
jgi:AcrR family transcriptional regulator